MKIIVAADKNWAIGKENKLLAHLPGDLKYFKERTTGKTVVMGRNTLESLPGGKPLPNRVNIVLTGNRDFQREGCITVNSLDDLFYKLTEYDTDDVLVIGGASVYAQLLEFCDTCYVTKIDHAFEGDVFFPDLDSMDGFQVSAKSEERTENGYNYTFYEYTRKNRE